MTKEKYINVVFMGCDKNRVDTEKMLAKLKQAGYIVTSSTEVLADVNIINTCAFIKSARDENLSLIKSFAKRKKTGQYLIVTGCFPALNLDELKKKVKGVDAYLKTNCENEIVEVVNGLLCKTEQEPNLCAPKRLVSTQNYAYLKIADGCGNKCTYCTIPKIRGPYHSEKFEDIIAEAEELVGSGIKELILVAQDVTRYGEDLYKKHRLVDLIQALSKIEGLRWIRLQYCYPEFIDKKLIKEISENDKVCKYLDMPLQHASDKILKLMNRASTKERTLNLLEKLRSRCPNISLRSTFIVGFPGETEEDFMELVDFINKVEFDNIGCFAFSKEKGTKAYDYDNQVPESVAKKREKTIIATQNAIMIRQNQKVYDTIVTAVCDEIYADSAYFRTEGNSPEIDRYIVVFDKIDKINVGECYKLKIIQSDPSIPNILIGEIV